MGLKLAGPSLSRRMEKFETFLNFEFERVTKSLNSATYRKLSCMSYHGHDFDAGELFTYSQ